MIALSPQRKQGIRNVKPRRGGFAQRSAWHKEVVNPLRLDFEDTAINTTEETPRIIDHGGGPQLAGHRIYIQHLLPYFKNNTPDAEILRWLPTIKDVNRRVRKLSRERWLPPGFRRIGKWVGGQLEPDGAISENYRAAIQVPEGVGIVKYGVFGEDDDPSDDSELYTSAAFVPFAQCEPGTQAFLTEEIAGLLKQLLAAVEQTAPTPMLS